MRARLRSWWQQIKQHLVVIGLILALVVGIALIFLEVRLYGTGFAGKTLWEWLQLLIIPVVLAAGGYLFTFTISRNEQKAADQHNQTEREIALDNQREAALQAYIDKMSELLLHEHLGESPSNEVQVIARARTATVLRILDPNRRASLIQFLSQAGILGLCVENSAKSSFDWPLKNEYSLGDIDLRETNLNRVNLSMIHLEGANLQRASLREVNLEGTDLSGANLLGANLMHANLQRANLCGTNLQSARLFGADLRGATLIGANLERANLRESKVTLEQLDKAKTLKGATMPDGSIHP